MPVDLKDQAAIAGFGVSRFGRNLPESQLELAAAAFRAALDDCGLRREDVDGLSINMGWPLGLDYDRIAEVFGLDIRYVNQTWTHGRFVTMSLQHAAIAVAAGLADVVACITAISFTREREILGGPGDLEGTREEGGTHGEIPVYGLTAPASGAALAMQRYMALYGATSAELAAVPITLRRHASLNPGAIMQEPLSLEAHQTSRMVVEPLRLFDCCLVSDGAAVVLVTSAERARDLKAPPVYLSSMQGIRAGRDEFIFAPPGLGINQQAAGRVTPKARDLEVYAGAGIERADVQGLYTYDAFSPLVLFVLERFGFCAPGTAAGWVQDGRIGLGGALPVNTSGGAHVRGPCQRLELDRGDRPPAPWPGRRTADPGSSVPTVGHGLGRFPDLPELKGRPMDATAKPLPRITVDNRPFWEACRRGELHHPHCPACGRAFLPPGPVCPYCFGTGVAWRRASGRGTVSSFVVVHQKWFAAFADDIPYNAAQVELEEGPRLTASLVGIDNEAIAVGLEVEVVSMTSRPRSPCRAFVRQPEDLQSTASTSISTSISGRTRPEISTSVEAGRIEAKRSACALAMASV